ncbi:hypothetical protein pb186bvf_009117 [Paramecium bursaria]
MNQNPQGSDKKIYEDLFEKVNRKQVQMNQGDEFEKLRPKLVHHKPKDLSWKQF